MNPNQPTNNLYSAPNSAPAPQNRPSIVEPVRTTTLPEFRRESPAKTVAIILLTLTTVAFIGLFIWMYMKWDDASSDLNSKIDAAKAEAVFETTVALEDEFAEREKNPYSTFSGPEDYGNLSFPYPKTWSLYVSQDAHSGGNFEAYFNPGGVQPTSQETINALRLTITNSSFESMNSSYESYIQNGTMSLKVINVNNGASTANVYYGTLPSRLIGAVAIIKIRDKTAILQTDSSEVFGTEFEKILSSLVFNS